MSDALTSISQAAAQVVVAGAWQGSLVVATVWLGLRCLPRVSAAHRFVIWSAAFLLVTIMPFSELLGGSGAVSGKSLQLDAGWGIALALVWLASVIYRATGLLRQAWRVRQIWLKATPLDAPAGIAVLLADCPRQPGLFASTDVDAPSVIGFLSPRLLLPVGLSEQISGAELRQIVLHECEHLRRGDDWLNLLQKVALAVFPLHLALVWMDRRMGLERELACDAGVIAATGAPLDYAACLARLAEHRMGGGRLALALSAWARRSELARRVYTLLEPVREASKAGSRRAMVALASLLLVTGVVLSRVPQLITFAGPSPTAALTVEPSFEAPRAAMVPVVFHPDSAQPARVVKAKARLRMRANLRRVQARPMLQMPWAYSVSERPVQARETLVRVKLVTSYAAVPFGDGWLIVQL